MDGGSADNLPVEPLYQLEKCEIIRLRFINTVLHTDWMNTEVLINGM